MKRLFDVIMAAALLLILSPLMLALAAVIRLTLGSPVVFKQLRPGLGGKPFILLKFRTMLNARQANGVLLSDIDRLTPFGRMLRSTSLDELPELWNVLKGDMSLVGPRPLLIEYLPLYSSEESRRHLVRPGLTGWAQVNGRNTISWEEKLALDVWYVEHRSFTLDSKILVMTLFKVLTRHGISAEGEATMSPFRGSRRP